MRYGPLLAMVLCLASTSALAEESSFHQRVGVEAAWVSTNDRLDPYADVEDPETPGSDPGSSSRVDVIPVIDLGWRLDSIDSTVYLATPFRAPGFPLALGISHRVGDGTVVDFSVFSVLDQREWRDPYVASDDKKQSHVKNVGMTLDFSEIASTGFGATVQWQAQKVTKDELADRFPELDRTGGIWSFTGRYALDFGGDFHLGPALSYEKGDFDGKANSFRTVRGGLSCWTEGERFAMNAHASYGRRKYSDTNPAFGETLTENLYTFSTLLTWKRPLGVKSLYLNAHGAVDVRDTGIGYHDAESYLFGLGASLGF